jgi:hypothetical protein
MVRPKDKPEKTEVSKAGLPKTPPPPTMLKASLDKAAPAIKSGSVVAVKKDAPAPVKKREQRTKSVRVVKVCPKCGAFMIPTAHFAREGETAAFTADNRLRSFGGVEVRTFECEKCHHTTQFQIDPFPKDIGEE